MERLYRISELVSAKKEVDRGGVPLKSGQLNFFFDQSNPFIG